MATKTDPGPIRTRQPFSALAELFEDLHAAGAKVRLSQRGDGVVLGCYVPPNRPLPDELRERLISARDDVILVLTALQDVVVQ